MIGVLDFVSVVVVCAWCVGEHCVGGLTVRGHDVGGQLLTDICRWTHVGGHLLVDTRSVDISRWTLSTDSSTGMSGTEVHTHKPP